MDYGIPFFRRLHLQEYFALLVSVFLLSLEIVVRLATLALPVKLIDFFYHLSRRLYNSLSSPQSRKTRTNKKKVYEPIANAQDFTDLCQLFGYYAEEHVVQTEDGYLLGLHRLAYKKGEEGERVNNGPGSAQKKVVYLHHGLMMNSEVWVVLDEEQKALPFKLVEQGYDVWLGNNRGNKYSKKSVHHSPASQAFWNFSIDQFAFHDIPDSIDYILSATGQPSLSYIGFSQGSAQAFATLSIHPLLNERVDVFVALAPAMAPPGLANGIVASFVKSSPELLYLFFSRRSILSSANMWQAILYPPIFVRTIEISLRFLFNWSMKNITQQQKMAALPHLYSFASTKCVVHWFQIIRNGTFQMFDDEVQRPIGLSDGKRATKVAKFPTRNIRTPIVLVYGGSDSLVDIKIMLRELPKHTSAVEIPHYEHLDFLWASDVKEQVFPHVFNALDKHAREPVNGQPWTQNVMGRRRMSERLPPSYSEDERARILQGAAHPGSHPSPLQNVTSTSYAKVTGLDGTAMPEWRDVSPSRSSIGSRGSATEAKVGSAGITVGGPRVAENIVVKDASPSPTLDRRTKAGRKRM